MSTVTLDIQTELARLDAAVRGTEAAWRTAKQAADRAVVGAGDHSAVVALRDYEDGVLFRKPGADTSPERQRELTLGICRAIEANPDLVLSALGAAKLRLDDVGPARRLHEARDSLGAATRERDQFKANHADELEAERERRERASVRDALESGDKDAIRDALGLPEKPTALRTTDFFRPSGRN